MLNSKNKQSDFAERGGEEPNAREDKGRNEQQKKIVQNKVIKCETK